MKFWGATSGDEIDQAIDHIRKSPGVANLTYVIADYLEVEDFPFTEHQTLLIAAHDHWVSKASPNLKIAPGGGSA
jgi:hypothetical protein